MADMLIIAIKGRRIAIIKPAWSTQSKSVCATQKITVSKEKKKFPSTTTKVEKSSCIVISAIPKKNAFKTSKLGQVFKD